MELIGNCVGYEREFPVLKGNDEFLLLVVGTQGIPKVRYLGHCWRANETKTGFMTVGSLLFVDEVDDEVNEK